MKALVIARLTFREGLRKKLVLGVVLLSLVFIVLYVWAFPCSCRTGELWKRVEQQPERA
jgi:hypothetical protein